MSIKFNSFNQIPVRARIEILVPKGQFQISDPSMIGAGSGSILEAVEVGDSYKLVIQEFCSVGGQPCPKGTLVEIQLLGNGNLFNPDSTRPPTQSFQITIMTSNQLYLSDRSSSDQSYIA